MYYYIYKDEFITTDVQLDPNEVGENTIDDYRLGKYVQLNEDQVKYMKNNPDLNGDSRYDYPYIGGQKQRGRKPRTLSEEEVERLTY